VIVALFVVAIITAEGNSNPISNDGQDGNDPSLNEVIEGTGETEPHTHVVELELVDDDWGLVVYKFIDRVGSKIQEEYENGCRSIESFLDWVY